MQELVTNSSMYVAFHLQDVGALDKEVAEPTETRQKEHEDFTETLAANTAAVDLLKFAKNCLNKLFVMSTRSWHTLHLTLTPR